MILRTLGFKAQELETGPFIFLLSDSIPVAYQDTREGAFGGGLYRSDLWLSKTTTRHVNQWIGERPHSVVPHKTVLEAFQSISRWTESVPR